MLQERSAKFEAVPIPPRTEDSPTDFNEASDDMDKSFHYLRTLLDQVSSFQETINSRDSLLYLRDSFLYLRDSLLYLRDSLLSRDFQFETLV